MIREALRKLMEQAPLTREEARQVMTSIMEGQATPAQIGALLVALRMKGEAPEEVAGFAAAMREKATPVSCPEPERTVDIVGTGGDGKHTINISTLAALVVAGAGVPVAKHGNRSVSSKCGSADVLQALGVNLDLDARQLSRCLEAVGMAFLFAPKLHPAMKHAIGPRRELGVRTVFNILGPITNPAGVRRQLIGVFSRDLARLLARVLQQLGATHILLVHSDDGLDEISLAAPTYVVELKEGDIREYRIDARAFGLSPQPDGITGGDAETNAAIARRILEGEAHPAREVV
ncbi:MAG: anthranilate phosphoribosyltransferase, partial [Calditrichaeota bacterium]